MDWKKGASEGLLRLCSRDQNIEEISIADGNLLARLITTADGEEMRACQRLRYDYFVCQKRWVEANPTDPGHEADKYDPFAHHLAVFREQEVLAYLRLLIWHPAVGFMLNQEFSCLLLPEQPHTLIRDGAAEISRLVINPTVRTLGSRRAFQHCIELLFKLFYRVALHRHLNDFYIEVEVDWLDTFATHFGLNFIPIGNPCIFPDGTPTIAAHATRRQLECSIGQYSAEKLKWY
ncbi:MAG: GNAT family N-acetyltransferase, partial [Abitibacteriaceae bacterium]|nr:GNAT family N-acetyltransferase [Abditibacteriaceae bacterium]